MSYLRCENSLIIDEFGTPQCDSWSVITDEEMSSSASEFLGQILTELSAVNDFSLTTTASLIAFYLLIFSLGFIAGNVARLLKKA